MKDSDHISPSHFRKRNWFLVERSVELRNLTTVFKYWKIMTKCYLNEAFTTSLNNYKTKLQMTLDITVCKTNKGQKTGP